MKTAYSYINSILFVVFALMLGSCVHDDKYNTPDLSGYQCGELKATMTLKELKAKAQNETFTEDDVVEGYVSSSDETGNIYKYIFIQDSPSNPTEGLVISADAVSMYTKYPQGAKVYIKLKGLAMGQYGSFVQLGAMDATGTFGRISEKMLYTNMIRSCTEKATIVPHEMTLSDMRTANDQYVGTLIKVKDASFHANALCTQYASEGNTVNRSLIDPTFTGVSRVVRTSGYASFATKTIPSGQGDFVGILSKFGTTYQLYIVRDTDLDMTKKRSDGLEAPCAADASAAAKTVAEVKKLYNGSLKQISDNITLTGRVIANDETGNLFKSIYLQDATGGIKININMTSLYLDRRFQVGRLLTVNLKDLYLDSVNGELQIGGLFQNRLGQVETGDVYKHFYRNETPVVGIVATERTLSELTPEDVGKWVKIKNLQFIDSDLGKNYAEGNAVTNRTLMDCSGNTILLRTSGYANFGTRNDPFPANSTEIDPGKGDVYGVLSIFNGTYQLWITKLRDIDLDNPRCDGSLPVKTTALLQEGFTNLDNWTTPAVVGTRTWFSINRGNPTPAARMDGNRENTEAWLVTKNAVSLAGYSDAYLSFESDGRYSGNVLEVYATTNYTGNPATTSWTKLDAVFDTNLNAWDDYTPSGKISLKNFSGQNIYVGFKYASSAGASTIWTIDNVQIRATK